VFRKSLRLSNKARQEKSTGGPSPNTSVASFDLNGLLSVCGVCAAITNYMSTDSEKIQMQTIMLHNIWSSPARIIVAMYLIYTEMGAAVFVGVGLLIAVTPVQVKVMGKIAGLMKGVFKESDQRIKLMNEILGGMRVIKYYAWERSFREKVLAIRDRELAWLRKSQIARGVVLLLINLNPVVLSGACSLLVLLGVPC
jgi:ABC-type multidrug transport system fused ATPase/permease subunit